MPNTFCAATTTQARGLVLSVITVIALACMSASFGNAQTGPNCDTLPTITSPTELFAFGPISSEQTASFDFYLATNVTNPQGMQSGFVQKITQGSTMSLSSTFWWSGTIGIHNQLVAYLPGGSTALCAWSLTRLFRQVRDGILKQHLHDTAMGFSFSPHVVATANSAFDFYLYGDESEDYNNLFGVKNYKLEVRIDANRACDNTTHFVSLGDQTAGAIVNATTIQWSVGTNLDQGVWSVCLRITNSAGNSSGWFPLSAANGHYRHNMVVGDAGYSGATSVYQALASPFVRTLPAAFFVGSSIMGTLFNYFSFDGTLDMCNPMSASMFDRWTLANWNGSAKLLTMTVPQHAQAPGGGMQVICGASYPNSPWMLVSTNAILMRQCSSGQYYNDGSCFNPSTCSCNNVGACPKDETIDWTVASRNCICYSGFYGTNCEYADLPPPVSSLPHNSTVRRRTVVSFTAPDSAWDVYVNWTDNGTVVSCTSVCYAYLPSIPRHSAPINFTVKLWSRSSNGSETSEARRPTYTFIVEPPTLSQSKNTISLSESHTETSSQSETATDTGTRTPPPTPTVTPTRTKTLPPTPTHEPTATRSLQTADPATCAAALNETPAVFQSPTKNRQWVLDESMRCGQCQSLACSFGFAGSCDIALTSFWINMSYISLFPTPHCNVTFFDPVNDTSFNLTMSITILPAVMTASNIWVAPAGALMKNGTGTELLRTNSYVSIGLVNYSLPPPEVEYAINNTNIQVRICSTNTSNYTWQSLQLRDGATDVTASSLTRISLPQLMTSSVLCLEISISSSPVQTAQYTFSISLTQLGDSGNLFGFVKGDIAALLSDVAQGIYLPAVSANDPSRVNIEVSSAFAEENQVAPEGFQGITGFNTATFAVIAVSLLAGGVIAYFVYQANKPKPRDHVKGVVNAMLAPDQLLWKTTTSAKSAILK